MKTVGYIRVSRDSQVESGLSLESQESTIRSYCSFSGLELVEVLREEGVSAGINLEDRPEGQRLVRMTQNGQIQHVVSTRLDRLFRRAVDCLQRVESWTNQGVQLHLLDLGGNVIKTGTASGKMFLTMTAGFAEMERDMMRERIQAAMAVKRERGEKTGGTVPIGYRTEKVDGVKILVPNPEEQAVIRRIVRMKKRGYSLRRIAGVLERTKTLGRCWHPQTISNILKREQRMK